MKPITSYKELLESFIKQIKESEVTDERIVDLHMYIDNSLELAKYRDSKPMSLDDFMNRDEHRHLIRTVTGCAYLSEEYKRYKDTLI